MSLPLLTWNNPKLEKGDKRGYLSAGLHLAPERLSGHNVCPMATKGCSIACLNTSGRGIYERTQLARIRKTKWFFDNRDGFMAQLVSDIKAIERKAAREHKKPCIRLNMLSDIQWETIIYQNKTIFEHFSHIQFLDYTKIPTRFFKKLPANYHLTFSRSENNSAQAELLMKKGVNVAVVFDTPKNKPLPRRYMGIKTLDGTLHDLRFRDKSGRIVALRALGRGRYDDSGFVVRV